MSQSDEPLQRKAKNSNIRINAKRGNIPEAKIQRFRGENKKWPRYLPLRDTIPEGTTKRNGKMSQIKRKGGKSARNLLLRGR